MSLTVQSEVGPGFLWAVLSLSEHPTPPNSNLMIEQVPGIAQRRGDLWWRVKEQKVTVFMSVRAARAPELVEVSILTLLRKK